MIYLLHGDEEYLISKEVGSLKQKFKDYSLEKFDAPAVKELAESLKTPSLFSPQRLVIAAQVDLAEEEDILLDALENLDPAIELILVSPLNLDRRRKACKGISKIGQIKEFKSFTDWQVNEVISWIIKCADSQSKKISAKAAGLLLEISGKNLLALDSEIKKLSAYAGSRNIIEENDVLTLASQKDVHVFSFVDALKEKSMVKAFRLQEKILKDQAQVVPLVSVIASQFRTLFCVKLLSDQKADPSAISRRTGYHPFYVKKCIEQARGFSSKRLRRIMELLHQADLDLKRGESSRVILPLLVEEICRG